MPVFVALVSGRGLEKLAMRNADVRMRAGRGVPDEARDFAQEREDDILPSDPIAIAVGGPGVPYPELDYSSMNGQTARGASPTPEELEALAEPGPKPG